MIKRKKLVSHCPCIIVLYVHILILILFYFFESYLNKIMIIALLEYNLFEILEVTKDSKEKKNSNKPPCSTGPLVFLIWDCITMNVNKG